MALSPPAAVVYLAAYCFSAIGSMVGVAGLLGRLANFGGQTSMRRLMMSCGAGAIGLGLFWTYQGAFALI